MEVERSRVYVWEYPVRLTHWFNFLCILVLSVTGFYIGNPFLHAYSSEQFIMGWVRFIHFIAAYLFIMSMIIRIYWSIMGNKYASFKTWFPLSTSDMRKVLTEFKFYFLISKKPPKIVGHTYIGGVTMLIMYAIFIFEIVSGFAMYSVTHSGTIWKILGGWLLVIMSLPTVRLYHHLFMYAILVFALVHVYIAWYSDVYEKNSLMGSIFSGYKFITGKEQDLKS